IPQKSGGEHYMDITTQTVPSCTSLSLKGTIAAGASCLASAAGKAPRTTVPQTVQGLQGGHPSLVGLSASSPTRAKSRKINHVRVATFLCSVMGDSALGRRWRR